MEGIIKDKVASYSKFNSTPSVEFNEQKSIGTKGFTDTKNSVTSGKFITKLRASTCIPIEHKFVDNTKTPNVANPIKVVSLDKSCASCSSSTDNEIIMKAFKMACL